MEEDMKKSVHSAIFTGSGDIKFDFIMTAGGKMNCVSADSIIDTKQSSTCHKVLMAQSENKKL